MSPVLEGLPDINLLPTEGPAECTTSGGKVLHRFADQAMAAVALTYARLGPTRRRRRSCGVSRRGVVRPPDAPATHAAAGETRATVPVGSHTSQVLRSSC